MKGKKIVSTLLALLLLANLPVSALAAEWDIGNGDITVNAGSGGQTVTQGSQVDVPDSAPVITGSSTENTLTINAEKDQTASVTLSGANIDGSNTVKAAVSTTGEGNVSIELDGDNTLKSGKGHAGLEKNNGGKLTIADEDKNGKLTAEGGKYGAGIGGGNKGNGDNIAITGGEVEATGGYGGAGIGGGNKGDGKDIAISGDAKVDAQGGDQSGAGIGGGKEGAGSGIAISGGEVKATGGDFGAGIGGGENGDGSDITISGDARVNAQGGDGGAGIGGGYEGDGKDIEITGGNVEATGGRQAAGIGGGWYKSGSGITISAGEVTATGGEDGAGIGGGNRGNGSGITISGGEVIASSKNAGAGIGGGDEGNGEDITITGGEVKASSENVGAGIGGGYKGDGKRIKITGGIVDAASNIGGAGIGGGAGSLNENNGNGEDITISGGEVTAKSSKNGAGIGGGMWGKGKDITVSGDAQLKVQGGVGDYFDGPGAGIGDGGSRPKGSTGGSPIPGAEVGPDTSGLTTNGSIEYYAPGADMEKDKPTSTTVGASSQPEKPTDPGTERGADAPLYRVTDQDGKDIAHKAERKDGVLTVTVDADFAILTGKLSSIDTLKRQGIEKIVFVTNKAASTFQAADLLEKGASSDEYRLTHDGTTVTFVVSEKKTDVSGILIQP